MISRSLLFVYALRDRDSPSGSGLKSYFHAGNFEPTNLSSLFSPRVCGLSFGTVFSHLAPLRISCANTHFPDRKCITIILIGVTIPSDRFQAAAVPAQPTMDALVAMANSIPALQGLSIGVRWNISNPQLLCSWAGVACVGDLVVGVNLASISSLNGLLPAAILELNSLQTLDLGYNNIRSTQPSSIS